MPPASITSAPGMQGAGPERSRSARNAADLAARWAALHEAAAVVAGLGGQVCALMVGAVRGFPAAIVQAGGQRMAVARIGMDDLSAMLETGLKALLTLHGRGVDPRSAAEALWQEFVAARDALVALAPPERRALG